MVDPPRLHKQLGANWVKNVTKAVTFEALKKSLRGSEFENAASNTRLVFVSKTESFWQSRAQPEQLLSFNKKKAAGVGQPFA